MERERGREEGDTKQNGEESEREKEKWRRGGEGDTKMGEEGERERQ